MAKKLVYNYTFTPGASNAGKIVIKGNYPAKTWQLVTDVGTGGLYPHIFVRDEYAGSTGALEIISGGSGNLTIAVTGTSLNENTGVMTVTTTTAHGLSTGATVKFRPMSVTFTCAKDNYSTDHTYPRTTDPIYDTAVPVTVIDGDTFTVATGRSIGGAISSNNEIIYNFADNSKGGSTYYDSSVDETTLTLKYDTSHLDPLDQLQIFIDIQEDKINFSETFTDPVSKLRVSNPQNLIDTDFEYGLQPTKWETVELVNNIPSFFADASNYSISDVTSVTSTANSENITVSTLEDHGLTVGSPIDVQGLTSRTAEGKYLVTAVISNTQFVYKAKAVQESSRTINGTYTVITPGEFYSGSDINIKPETGIETDGVTPSSLKINTDYHHGFERGSSLYLTNTVGSRRLTIEDTTTDTAPDGRPYVDYEDTLSTTLTVDSSLTETRQMTGTYAHKFTSSEVNIANNTIFWNNHKLQAGDVLLYSAPSSGTAIGGLNNFDIYYVKSAPTANTITLCEVSGGNYTGNATINFNSAGDTTYGRHELVLGYELYYAQKQYRSYYINYRTRAYGYGSGSGRDMNTRSTDASGNSGYWGLGGEKPERFLFASKSGYISSTYVNASYYGTSRNGNFQFGNPNLGYNFLEDFERFNSTSSYERYCTGNGSSYNSNFSFQQRYFQGYFTGSTYYWGSYATSFSLGTTFYFPLKTDPEADSLYIPNHGVQTGGTGTLTTTSGSNIVRRTDTSKAYNVTPTTSSYAGGTTTLTRVSSNRIRLNDASRLHTVAGEYQIAANVTNPTKNSFYYDSHELFNNQEVTISSNGGSVPSSSSGPVALSDNLLQPIYDAVKTALDSIKTTMGSDSGRILFNGSSHYYPIRSSSNYFDNAYQYFIWYIQYMRVNGPANVRSSFFGSTNFATGTPWDPFASTSLAGKGYYHICTPYVSNSYTPYHINMWQIPNPQDEGATTTEMYVDSRFAYHYARNGTPGYENNSYNNWINLSDGWQYTYETNYIAPSSSYHGYLHMYMILSNTGWDGHQASWTRNLYYPNSRYLYAYTTGYGGSRYAIEVIIPIKGSASSSGYGANGSVINNATVASTIANQIKNDLTNPTLTPNSIVRVNPINNNRFSVKTAGDVEYDLTNSGTAPLSFQTGEITGGLDGYFTIDAKDATSLTHFSSSEIPKRTLDLTDANIVDIGGIVYINKGNFKMQNQQKFEYTASSGTIPGLTSGQTYYTVSNGPDHFRVAASAADAESGNVISIGTTTSGSFTFTVPSISGISSATGTIGITSDSKTITGTGTLFKRFFRTGDNFRIKDEQTPPAYRDFEIASVIDDTELTITETPGIEVVDGNYYVETKINTRPDGTFIHRPFDGGVEITAGTSPNSSIVRQTRKYFRYQSGKGIQCSVAINFNPSRIINNIVGTGNTQLSVKTFNINVNNNETTSYNISGNDRDGRILGENSEISITKGDTLNLIVNAPSHPLWIKTDQSVGTGNSVTTGITNNGADLSTIVWDTTSVTPGTYYYNCQNHETMRGSILVETAGITTSIAKATTSYPHGLTRRNSVTIRGSSDAAYNGTHQVRASDDFTFEYYVDGENDSVPNGVLEYNIDAWSNSAVRTGLFDYQNGMFFEFDGTTLYAVRRSSVQQLSGTVSVQPNSNIVTGTDTNLSGQLSIGDFVVIRGSSYRVTNVPNKTTLHVQPAYKGVASSGVIVTKTIDVRVPQNEWNIDKADGSGPSGFVLDITKIQMAYIDYSWYGAGKIRFGFKDAKGHVKYMHEFLHNNVLEEAYMRSGNMPGRYEIENTSDVLPSFVPSLFHWGTSVIMDGKFDDDKAYLFSASSNSLSFTNGDSNSVNASSGSSLVRYYDYGLRQYKWYTRIPFASSNANKFSSGTPLYTDDGGLNGELVDYLSYSGNTVYVHIFVGTSRYYYQTPASYPTVSSGEEVFIGAPSSGGDLVNLQEEVPLISIRLAPSVDNNLTGSLGQREIINRMQLQLKQLGITLSHDCTVDLILNGAISNRNFVNATTPSLSELVTHVTGDKVIGGTKIFSLRASGGSENAAGKRLSATNDFDISQITDLGNSILGGDGTFPNGPDLLTIAIRPIDTAEINATSPLAVSARVTWTESQA